MIHPYFTAMEERDAAEAFSELMVPGEYKNNYKLDRTFFAEDSGSPFPPPPEPAYLTSLTAAYFMPDNNLRRVALHGISGPEIAPCDDDLVDAYDQSVTQLQEVAASIEHIAPMMGLVESDLRFGRLGKWCVDTAMKAHKRVAAAHLIFVSVDGKRLHHGLSYPTEIKDEFPLLIRDFFKPVSTDLAGAEEILNEYSEADELKRYLVATLRNDEDVQMTAGLPPSTLMIPATHYRLGLREHHKTQRSQRRSKLFKK